MAEIVIRNTNERITGEENVREFLNNQEVVYEHWNMENSRRASRKFQAE